MRTLFIGYNPTWKNYRFSFSNFPFYSDTITTRTEQNGLESKTYKLREFKYNIPEFKPQDYLDAVLEERYLTFRTKEDGHYYLFYVEESLIDDAGYLPSKLIDMLEDYIYDLFLAIQSYQQTPPSLYEEFLNLSNTVEPLPNEENLRHKLQHFIQNAFKGLIHHDPNQASQYAEALFIDGATGLRNMTVYQLLLELKDILEEVDETMDISTILYREILSEVYNSHDLSHIIQSPLPDLQR